VHLRRCVAAEGYHRAGGVNLHHHYVQKGRIVLAGYLRLALHRKIANGLEIDGVKGGVDCQIEHAVRFRVRVAKLGMVQQGHAHSGQRSVVALPDRAAQHRCLHVLDRAGRDPDLHGVRAGVEKGG
jgi:hypothetical protein